MGDHKNADVHRHDSFGFLLSRWSFVALLALLGFVAAYGFSQFLPREYTARSLVLNYRTKPQIRFDPAIQTITENDLAEARNGSTAKGRLIALRRLVQTPAIAEEVLAKLGDELPRGYDTRVGLLSRVQGEQEGDLLWIEVSGDDPTILSSIADEWARQYVAHVNLLYAPLGSPEQLAKADAEMQLARIAYRQAEDEYLQFVDKQRLDSRRAEVERKRQILALIQREKRALFEKEADGVRAVQSAALDRFLTKGAGMDYLDAKLMEKRTLLDSLLKARKRAIEKVVSQASDRALKRFEIYARALEQNSMLAFEKEQEQIKLMLHSIIRMREEGRLAGIRHEHEARIMRMQNLYTRLDYLRELYLDAWALKNQAQDGKEEGTIGTGFALFMLKQRLLAGSGGTLPIFQIGGECFVTEMADGETVRAEIEVLVQQALARVGSTRNRIAQEARDLFSGDAYEVPNFEQSDDPLMREIRKCYHALFKQGPIAVLAENPEGAVITPLHISLKKAERDALALEGALSYVNESPLTDNGLSTAIKALTSDISEMEEARAHRVQAFFSSTSTRDMIKQLTRVDHLVSILEVEGEGEVSKRMFELSESIRTLEFKIIKAEADQKELERERSLTWTTYVMLAQKVDELRVASKLYGSEVRFVSPSVAPTSPVSPNPTRNGLLASVVLGLLGIVAVLLQHRLKYPQSYVDAA